MKTIMFIYMYLNVLAATLCLINAGHAITAMNVVGAVIAACAYTKMEEEERKK